MTAALVILSIAVLLISAALVWRAVNLPKRAAFDARWKAATGPATVTQAPPLPNDYPAIWDLVMDDMRARDALGAERYGQRLKPHDGRDSLADLYQEQLDAAVYTRKLLFERDGK